MEVVEPVCLNSITIRSGETVQSIAFSFSDKYGKPGHAGPWGAKGGRVVGHIHTILLGPSEYVTNISGTVGMSTKHARNVVTSLKFTTNIRVYGPFGRGAGVPFGRQLKITDRIVGFFARAFRVVDAIGIYVKPAGEPRETKALITKIGPWGGDGGRSCNVDVLPRRLISVVVRSNEVIDSIAFTYMGCDGKLHSAGPWGGHGATRNGTSHTIVLGRSEFLKGISGTIGPSPYGADVVTSLLFVTNTCSYGSFGGGKGVPFCSPELNNGGIDVVGFFIRFGRHLDAIGVYIDTIKEKDNSGTSSDNPNPESDIKELNKPCIMKIGLWGGDKGSLCDVDVAPFCLNNITVCSGEVVHSLAFSYSDDRGKQHHAGPWGVSAGSFDMIQLGSSEFLTEVSGTLGSFTQYHHDVDVLTSVLFTTNARSYGPFGRGGGVPFHSPEMISGSITGFFAHSGKGAIDAIGIYVNTGEPMEKRGLITKVGPWGNHLARSYDLDVLPQHLLSIVVCSGQVIDSLTFTYIDCDGQQHSVGPWGGQGAPQDGSFHTILFGPSEFLKGISGTIKLNPHSSDVVTSVLLVTNTGNHGPFGEGGGAPFFSPVQDNSTIVGFFAGAGKSINALGVYRKTTNHEDNDSDPCKPKLQGDLKELDKVRILKMKLATNLLSKFCLPL
uniref:Jacalin-type lectin domain-containing protein n=1 Tax=Hordeum vulgare subsp. vulgare TaxID=112509 RepID=A0A8I6XYD5_HORVV